MDEKDIDKRLNSIYRIQPDSVKVDSLIQFGREVRSTFPERAVEIFNECVKLSQKNELDSRFINSYIQISAVYIIHHNWDSAQYYCDISIHYADSLNQSSILANAYRIKAIIYRKSGFHNQSLSYLQKSIQVLGDRDSLLLAKIFNSLGLFYFTQSLYDSATYYYLKGYNILKLKNREEDAIPQLINLADIFLGMKEYEKAKHFLYECIDLLNKREDVIYVKFNKALICSKLGEAFYIEQKYDSALYMFKKCEYNYKELNNRNELIDIYSNIGVIYGDLQLFDSASRYYKLAIKTGKDINQVNRLGNTYNNLAVINMRLGELDAALKNLKLAMFYHHAGGDVPDMLSTINNIYETYELKEEYDSAFKYLKKYEILSDSIFNIEKAKVISDLEMKYEKEKDQAHILELRNENLQKDLELNRRTNQRNFFLAGGSGILVISILIFSFYRQRVKKDKIIADQRIEKLEREKKLLAAKSIVEGQEEERKRIARELHDGLGVLLSTAKMQFKSIEDKSPENREVINKAALLLERASSDVRRISHNMMPGILTKLGLDEALEDLVESINDTPDINAVLNIENEEEKRLPENSEIMIYRVLQEMVNNTLKYAEASKVILEVNYDEDSLSIQYTDNGKGFDVEEKLKSKSIGLTSIQSRIDFLGGKLNINSKSSRGTSYFITIPVKGIET
jgi:signal transduction histidine kinase